MSFGAVAAIGGAVIGASASKSAAKKQAGSVDAATAAQQAQFDQQMELLEPYRDSGVMANNRLMHLLGLQSSQDTEAIGSAYDSIYQRLRADADAKHRAQHGFGLDDAPGWAQGGIAQWDENLKAQAKKEAQAQVAGAGGGTSPGGDFGSLMKNFSMEDFEADPGYQFRMDEGMRGVEGGAAARGGLLSGAALKAIQKYGQGLASQEYGNAYNRYTSNQTNQYNKLMGLVGSGQGAAQQTSNAAGAFGQSQANNLIQGGNAAAAGTMGAANNLVGGINQGFNAYQNNQLMNLIRNPGSGGGGSNWGSLNNQYFSGNQGMGG